MLKHPIPWIRVVIWIISGAIGLGATALVGLLSENIIAVVIVAGLTGIVIWFQGLLMAMKYPYGPFSDRDHWPFEDSKADSRQEDKV
jgi:hypothetical protein